MAEVYTGPDAPTAILDEKKALEGGEVLPGFTLPLAELFEHLAAAPGKHACRAKETLNGDRATTFFPRLLESLNRLVDNGPGLW